MSSSSLLLLFIVSFFTISSSISSDVCTVPPDLWCEHAYVAALCQAEEHCRRYEANVVNRKTNVTLFYETHCIDSQLFIVDRLYPKVYNDSAIRKVANIDFSLWGMAKRLPSPSRVKCSHGAKECQGNKLISCARQHIADERLKMQFLFCFEQNVLVRLPVDMSRDSCYLEVGVADNVVQMISKCTEGKDGDDLLIREEKRTTALKPHKRKFVPWMTANECSLMEIQVYQLLLPQKLAIWPRNATKIKRTSPGGASSSTCITPPDFWCDDPAVTKECFDSARCATYRRAIEGKPIRLTVLLNTHCRYSRNFLLDTLHPKVWQNGALRDKVQLRLVPWGNSKRHANGSVTCFHGDKECEGDLIAGCALAVLDEDKENNDAVNFVVCFMKEVRDNNGSNTLALQSCVLRLHWTKAVEQNIRECANGAQGRQLQKMAEETTAAAMPEKKQFMPWLIINDVSLVSAQRLTEVIDLMICIWYRGPGHDRAQCGRCLYEPTKCTDHI